MKGFTNSNDGVLRMSIDVPVRLTAEQMATLIVSEESSRLTNEMFEVLEAEELEAALKKILPNKKAVLEAVRDAVYDAGIEPNMYRVWDNNWDSAVAPTMARIEELFGK